MTLAAYIPVIGLRWPGGLVLFAVFVIWALIWAPERSRRIQMTSSIDVRCAPHTAFAFVSDPNNWPRYIPELELPEPVDVPLSVGATFRDRVARQNAEPFEAEERVIVFEPGSRFGTTSGHGDSGISEFTPIPGGTRVSYTYRAVVGFAFALWGGMLRRRSMVAEMAANRARINQRLKRVLEEQQTVTV